MATRRSVTHFAAMFLLCATCAAVQAADIMIFLGDSVTGQWLSSDRFADNYASSTGISAPFDLSRDWYAEFVQRLDRRGGVYTIAQMGGLNFRFLRGPIQAYYDSDGSTRYVYSGFVDYANLRWPEEESHHVMVVSTNHVAHVYVDGSLAFVSDYNSNYSTYPYSSSASTLVLYPYEDIRLMRVGYLACITNGAPAAGLEISSPDALVAQRFNGGKPLKWKGSEPARIVEVNERNVTIEKMCNRASDEDLLPDKWNTSVYLKSGDPYASLLRGEGEPTTVPRYAGQRYRDTIADRLYTATGNQVPADWRAAAYPADLSVVSFPTVNGISVVGSGPLEIVPVAYKNVEDVTEYGAVGDGVTDDSAAISAAVAAAKASGKSVYLPKTSPTTTSKGVYKVASPIELGGDIALKGTGATLLCAVSDGAALSLCGTNITVDGVSFVVDGAVNGTAVGIGGAREVRIYDCMVEGTTAANGIEIVDSADVTVEGCCFDGLAKAISLASATRVKAGRNFYQNCTHEITGTPESPSIPLIIDGNAQNSL